MNPTAKRILTALIGAVVVALSKEFPVYGPIFEEVGTVIGGLLIGAGLWTHHDAGHTTILGRDFGKKKPTKG